MAAWVAAALLVLSLPYWLPRAVIALRNFIFTAVNGYEGIPIPGPLVPAARFEEIYSHPAANGRSRGATLSDLFWYWLAPGPEIHQEHLEPGERYDAVARATRRFLAVPKRQVEELVGRAVARVLAERPRPRGPQLVRLRRLMMPIWAELYYELVFRSECPRAARRLIVDNAEDVVSALKCCSLRHMRRRERLTRFLAEKVSAGATSQPLPDGLSVEEQALYLQGVFFNTAVVQMSEAMTHVLLVIAQHPHAQERVAAGDAEYLDRLLTEVLRVYPLFGISHRITSAEIRLGGDMTVPAGSVLCFNHGEYHRHGFDDPELVDPDRWLRLSMRDASYIPFGVAANRPCPAQAIALVSLRVATAELVHRYRFASTARHTRSVPNAGPCLLVTRGTPRGLLELGLLLWMRVRDLWEDVARSLAQLLLGTYMVLHARRLRLCERYFDTTR